MHGYEVIRRAGRAGPVACGSRSPGRSTRRCSCSRTRVWCRVEEADGRAVHADRPGQAEAERRSSDTTPWDEVTQGADPGTMELRRAVFQARSGSAGAESGTPEQVERVRQLLVETRKRLYSILAEEE